MVLYRIEWKFTTWYFFTGCAVKNHGEAGQGQRFYRAVPEKNCLAGVLVDIRADHAAGFMRAYIIDTRFRFRYYFYVYFKGRRVKIPR